MLMLLLLASIELQEGFPLARVPVRETVGKRVQTDIVTLSTVSGDIQTEDNTKNI